MLSKTSTSLVFYCIYQFEIWITCTSLHDQPWFTQKKGSGDTCGTNKFTLVVKVCSKPLVLATYPTVIKINKIMSSVYWKKLYWPSFVSIFSYGQSILDFFPNVKDKFNLLFKLYNSDFFDRMDTVCHYCSK